MAKRSLELQRAERELRSAAIVFTEVLYNERKATPAANKKYEDALLDLYAKARAYSRLAELG